MSMGYDMSGWLVLLLQGCGVRGVKEQASAHSSVMLRG